MNRFNPQTARNRKRPPPQRVTINLHHVAQRDDWHRIADAQGVTLSTLIREAGTKRWTVAP